MAVRRLLPSVCLACLLFPVGPAAGFILTVHPDGSGTYPNIQAALNAAAPGDIVELTPGTFFGPGNRELDYHGKAVVVRSQSGPETCAIDCQRDSRAVQFQNGETRQSVLEGVTISNGSAWGSNLAGWGGGILCLESGPTIRNCRFYQNTATETGGAIAVYGTAGGAPLISGCIFEGNSTAICAQCDGGGAIAVMWSGAAEVEDCRCTDDYSTGGEILCKDSSTLHLSGTVIYSSIFGAVTCLDNSSVTIEGCTLGWIAGDGVVVLEGGSTADIRNTILDNSWEGDAVHCDGTSTPTLSCCDVFGDPAGGYTGCLAGMEGVSGNFSADPLFCAPETNVLLCSDSPCLPEHSPCGILVGAEGAGCGACGSTPTVTETWGRLKSGFLRP